MEVFIDFEPRLSLAISLSEVKTWEVIDVISFSRSKKPFVKVARQC